MKAHLFALLASLALVKAVPAPAEIQLQVTVHDEDHNSVRVLLSDDEVTKLELVYECAYRAHWGKPCYLKSARNGRWLGKCADRGSSGGDQYICIHYGLNNDGPVPSTNCWDFADFHDGKQCFQDQDGDGPLLGGICTRLGAPESSWICKHDYGDDPEGQALGGETE